MVLISWIHGWLVFLDTASIMYLIPCYKSVLIEGLGGYQMHKRLRFGRTASLCTIPMNLIDVLKTSTGQNQQNFKIIVFRTINSRVTGSGEALLHEINMRKKNVRSSGDYTYQPEPVTAIQSLVPLAVGAVGSSSHCEKHKSCANLLPLQTTGTGCIFLGDITCPRISQLYLFQSYKV